MEPIVFADLEYLARTVYGEARGEDFSGQIAVAEVVLNRAVAKHRREHRIAGVATEPMQFSCWNVNDANYRKLLEVDISDPLLRRCLVASLHAIDAVDRGQGLTMGATHYHTIAAPDGTDTWPPFWAAGKTPCATVGDHHFYNDID